MRTDADKTLIEARLALAAMVRAYVLMINAALDCLDGRKTLRLCQKLSTVIRNHLKVQDKIHALVLREELAENPAMRVRVQRDLGGRAAMVKWEIRRRGQKVVASYQAAINSITPAFASGPDGARSRVEPGTTGRRKVWVPKTDRFGNFRLAAIPTGPMPKRKVKIRRASTPRDMALKLNAVEVTAIDLLANRNCSTEYWLPPARDNPPSGRAPPIIRPPI